MSTPSPRLFLPILIAVPFLFPLFIPWMHGMDLATFKQWADAWTQSPREIYLRSYCNYPALGALFSAGILSIFDHHRPGIGFWGLMGRYRLFLAVFDAASALLVFRILQRFAVKRAWLWALVIAILPSTWAPTSVWGQIDGITQFFLLLWFSLWLVPAPGIAGAIAFACAALTKQLTIFAVPMFVAWVWIAGEMKMQKNGPRVFLRWAALIAAAVAGVVLLPEFVFKVPGGQHSTLAYVFTGERSDHYKKIAMNGFNVWTLLTKDPQGSSIVPLVGSLSPFILGVVAYGTSVLACGSATARAVRRLVPFVAFQEIAAFLLLLMATLELSCNVWLTGTHERYLAHFYAFAISGALIARKRGLAFLLCAGAVLYGAFVLIVLAGSASVTDFQSLWLMRLLAVAHFALWCVLMRTLFRLTAQNYRTGPSVLVGSANETQYTSSV